MGYRRFGAAPHSDGARNVVIALHGTPGSRLKFAAMDAPAKALGIEVIAPDRWGYGKTDVPSRPSLSQFVDDLAAFADGLGVERFAVVGVSGGGPYATCSAALLGRRIRALGLVSPVGPIAGRTAAKDMTLFHKFCFGVLPRLSFVTGAVFGLFRFGLRTAPSVAMKIAMAHAAPADKETIAQDVVRHRLITTFQEGLRPGLRGPMIDLQLFGREWGVQLNTITAPSRLWIGGDDRNVPLTAARDLSDCISQCAYCELAGEGHLWVATHYGEILDWVNQKKDGDA